MFICVHKQKKGVIVGYKIKNLLIKEPSYRPKIYRRGLILTLHYV